MFSLIRFLKTTAFIMLIAITPVDAADYTGLSAQEKATAISAEKLAEQQEASRLKRVKVRENKAKNLQKKITKIDQKILLINDDMNILKGEMELLDEKEAAARKRLSQKLDTFNETAITIARLERMPIEAMAAASSMRAAHSRKGIVEGGRKSLSGQISKNRADIYELQDIRTERSEKVKQTEVLQNKRLNEKKQLESLFEKQIKYLAADDAEKATLLKKAHAMKQKKTLNELLLSYKKTDAYLPQSQASLKVFPVQGKIVRGYNEADKNGVKSHGVTITSTASEPVTAVKDGRVIYSDRFREYGYIVILEHADGSNSLYSGMGKSDKKLGNFIYAGKKIGLMPNNSKPQLYLEIRQNGKTVNPSKYLMES